MARLARGLVRGPDGLPRCWWGASDDTYRAYHDDEWGFPVRDDRRLFEKINLEGFQSGLSWITILRKREHFRAAFAGFDYRRVARFDGRRVAALLRDTNIVRHRGKIESTINNARRAVELVAEFGSLARYFWRWAPGREARPRKLTRNVLVGLPSTEQSAALSRDLKKRGWTFVGPTTVYAFMQAMGLVNDHLEGCAVRRAAERARALFEVPA